MKAKIHALLLAAGCVVVPQVQAQGGWFDTDAAGFYAGAAANVTKVTGQLNRRLGGENDCGPGCTLVIDEPGFITTGFVRGGWRPVNFLAIEAHMGLPLDSDRIDNDSNSQHFTMDSLYGVYLKPQLSFGENDSFTVFGRVGISDFSFETRCYSTSDHDGSEGGPDRTVPTGCMQRDENGAIIANDDGSTTVKKTFSDSGLGWSGGFQLRLTAATRLAFEYNQHYNEDDSRVFGVGVGVTYLFGQDTGGDDFY